MILFFLDFINLLILTSSTLDMKHSRVLLVTTCDKLEIFSLIKNVRDGGITGF